MTAKKTDKRTPAASPKAKTAPRKKDASSRPGPAAGSAVPPASSAASTPVAGPAAPAPGLTGGPAVPASPLESPRLHLIRSRFVNMRREIDQIREDLEAEAED